MYKKNFVAINEALKSDRLKIERLEAELKQTQAQLQQVRQEFAQLQSLVMALAQKAGNVR